MLIMILLNYSHSSTKIILQRKEYLDGFAKHYETGKKMPQDLIDRFVKSAQFGAAYACMRQLGFGYLDMAYHTLETPLRASADLEEFEKNAQNPVRCFEAVDGCMTSPSFGHIFLGDMQQDIMDINGQNHLMPMHSRHSKKPEYSIRRRQPNSVKCFRLEIP